jgi:diacylglycerol kinase
MIHPQIKVVRPSELPHRAQKSEWARSVASFRYALSGLWYAVRTQRNMRVHIAMATLAIGTSIILHISPVEFALIFIAITGVFIAEMFNTVMELCVDLASPQYHPLAKIAKDVAAGAVLANALLSIIIGFFILGPHLFALL